MILGFFAALVYLVNPTSGLGPLVVMAFGGGTLIWVGGRLGGWWHHG